MQHLTVAHRSMIIAETRFLALHFWPLTSPELNLILDYLELKPTPSPGPYWLEPSQTYWTEGAKIVTAQCLTSGLRQMQIRNFGLCHVLRIRLQQMLLLDA